MKIVSRFVGNCSRPDIFFLNQTSQKGNSNFLNGKSGSRTSSLNSSYTRISLCCNGIVCTVHCKCNAKVKHSVVENHSTWSFKSFKLCLLNVPTYKYNTNFCNFCNGIRHRTVDIGVRILQNTAAELISLPSLFQKLVWEPKETNISTSLWNVRRFLQGFWDWSCRNNRKLILWNLKCLSAVSMYLV
jgi:hypothetical protein